MGVSVSASVFAFSGGVAGRVCLRIVGFSVTLGARIWVRPCWCFFVWGDCGCVFFRPAVKCRGVFVVYFVVFGVVLYSPSFSAFSEDRVR